MPQITSPTPDATSSTKGKVQLAGALGGSGSTAASPVLATGIQTATVATNQSTSTTSYTDLTTTGPAVTITIPASGQALVTVTCDLFNTTAGAFAFAGFALSGTNTVAASDAQALFHKDTSTNGEMSASYTILLTGLSTGSTTFTMKYKASGGTASFINRRIIVEPK